MKIKKSAFFIVVCSLLLFYITGGSAVNKREPKLVGIVFASKLNCRKSPSVQSKVVASYHFGTPLLLSGKTKKKTRVGRLNHYWYQDQKTKGWLCGGFLRLVRYVPKRVGVISVERIICNMVGGGMSFAYSFQPILINSYFIVSVPLTDYGVDPGQPMYGVVIGRYKKTPNKIIFRYPVYYGAYDLKWHWVTDFKLVNKAFTKNRHYYHRTLYKKRDQEGVYYVDPCNRKSSARKYLRAKCKDKNFKKSMLVNAYTYKQKDIGSLIKLFPGGTF